MKQLVVRAAAASATLAGLAVAFANAAEPWAVLVCAAGFGYTARVAWAAFQQLPDAPAPGPTHEQQST